LRNSFRTTRVLGCLLVGILALAGCSDDVVDTPMPNSVPDTHITSDSPKPFQSTSFRVKLNWDGEDRDGRVVGFYYAWDDTIDASGSLRWRFTALSESTFTVSADSCAMPPCSGETRPYFGYHTFWVKAVDDQGAHDPTPAHRTFNATTVAPTTEIEVSPAPCFCFYGETGSQFVFVRWHSDDPDGSVVGYWWDWDRKQAEYPTQNGPDPAADGWKFLPADSTTIATFRPDRLQASCQPPNSISIFAVDDAGAIEQVVACPHNWTCWCPTADITGPGLCVDGGILGVRSNPPTGARWCDPITLSTGEVSPLNSFSTVTGIFLGTPVRFRWARLEYPDGREAAPLAGYQYAIDDPNGWSVLSTSITEFPPADSVWVPSEGAHVFYVRSVDRAGAIQTGAFRFEVTRGPKLTDPPPTPRILLVDDNAPTDQFYGEWDDFHDDTDEQAFFDSVFVGFAFDQWDTQIKSSQPLVPLVAQYTTVIWNAGNPGGIGKSYLADALFKVRAEYLTSYVRSGGNILIMGMNPFWPMMIQSSEGGGAAGDVCGFPPTIGEWLYFDPTICGLTEETAFPHFLYTMLGVRQMHVPIAPAAAHNYEQQPSRMIRGAYPVDPAMFDTLEVDTLKAGGYSISHAYPGGPAYPPGSAQYIPAASTTQVTRMESWAHPIYYLNSADPTVTAANEVVGIYVDGNDNPRRRPSDPEWGKIVFLGFHPFFLKWDEAQDFMRTVLEDYFGEPYNHP
jgi:hypothetical protein